MDPRVALQVISFHKRFAADFTQEGPLPGVDLHVSNQRGAQRETSATDFTGEGLLARVDSGVVFQTYALFEGFPANFAHKRPLVCVESHVSHQPEVLTETLTTLFTRIALVLFLRLLIKGFLTKGGTSRGVSPLIRAL